MRKLKKPARLKAGDRVAVLGMSSPCQHDFLEKGLAELRARGFDPVVFLDPCAPAGHSGALFSSEPREARAQALEQIFSDPSINGIILARGGAGAQETLPLINFQPISQNPKFIVGFSDTTNLHIALYQQAGMATFHGPMAASNFARVAEDPAILQTADLFSMLLQNQPDTVFGDIELTEICAGNSDTAPLSGGNLSVLAGLIGTPWQPEFSGHIVLLEDVNNIKPHAIDRLLRQMKLAGVFDNIKGVITGYFTERASDPAPDRLESVLLDIFSEYDIPVLIGAPFGHAYPNYTWPYGIQAQIVDRRLFYRESIFND